MNGQNLKTEQEVHLQNLDDINPRLGKAMVELRRAIDNLDQKNKQLLFHPNKEAGLEKNIQELAIEKEDLFKKLEDLKERNSKLENANRQVQSKISGMIKTYNQFLDNTS
ncbi:MAG: DUF4164 family protein [Hyphomicrobiales bacterium]|jgi:septal ring factor EnvC (AmiA/AmiB activator)|nr:DUF4164 family protein [Hyphomicrobiales bacterium]